MSFLKTAATIAVTAFVTYRTIHTVDSLIEATKEYVADAVAEKIDSAIFPEGRPSRAHRAYTMPEPEQTSPDVNRPSLWDLYKRANFKMGPGGPRN
jgi:hypothetical protein